MAVGVKQFVNRGRHDCNCNCDCGGRDGSPACTVRGRRGFVSSALLGNKRGAVKVKGGGLVPRRRGKGSGRCAKRLVFLSCCVGGKS